MGSLLGQPMIVKDLWRPLGCWREARTFDLVALTTRLKVAMGESESGG